MADPAPPAFSSNQKSTLVGINHLPSTFSFEAEPRTVEITKTGNSLGLTVVGLFLSPVFVAHIHPDGPAERQGGLTAGDQLLKVNGVAVDGKSMEKVLQMLRETEGTVRLEVRYNKVSLDTLPEDLLVGIFDRLSLPDQTRLGACCSRFRSINLHKVSAKFDAVVVFWGDAFQSVNTYACYKALERAKCLQHGPRDERQLQVDECTERLFEKAKTNTLEITMKTVDDRANSLFSELFKSLQYLSLEIDFVVCGEHSIPLILGLMANRDLKKASFIIQWSRATHDDIERTRAFLLQFPIVKSLVLRWAYVDTDSGSLSAEVITDDVLLYLVGRCREELIVRKGDCTVNGLMDVYKKLSFLDCHHVRVTVRSEIAREFHQTVEEMNQPDRRVFIFLGQNTCVDGIFMQQIVLTKHPEIYVNLN